MEKREFKWILSSVWILQRATSIQGKFYIVNKQLQMSNCNILLFSEIKTLTKVMKFIFGIMELKDGIWRMVRILEPKITIAGCICIHQVRNKIKIQLRFLTKLNYPMGPRIRQKQIFKFSTVL